MNSSITKSKYELLHDVYNEIRKETRFNIENNCYIISFREPKRDVLELLYDFFCKNYYIKEFFKWKYSIELFEYFIRDSLVIIFYLPEQNTNTKIITGCIVGKPLYIMHDTNYEFQMISKCIDVNFLCVEHRLRGLGICRYLKNVLIKTTLEQDSNIQGALFTIGNNKEYNMYSQKQYYFKILNEELDIDFIPETTEINNQTIVNKDIQVKFYKTVKIDEKLLKYIIDKLNDKNRQSYSIFQMLNVVDLEDILDNPAFYKLFIMKDDKIIGFVILYNLDLEYNGVLIKNAFVYNYYFDECKSNNNTVLWKSIYKICKENEIHMITSTSKIYDFSSSSISLKYYDINLYLKEIDAEKNGLVTI